MSARTSLEDHIAAHRASAAPSVKKPRAKPARREDKLHGDCAKHLRAAIGREGIASSKHALWFSIENKPRSARAGASNKARGVISGVPDILVLVKDRYYFIELKRDKDGKSKAGTLQDTQKELHRELSYMGSPVGLCKSVDDLRVILRLFRIPTREAA